MIRLFFSWVSQMELVFEHPELGFRRPIQNSDFPITSSWKALFQMLDLIKGPDQHVGFCYLAKTIVRKVG